MAISEAISFLIWVIREAPQVIDAIKGLAGADPTPQQIAQWQSLLDQSTNERNRVIAEAEATPAVSHSSSFHR